MNNMKKELIAPCGMNCNVCSGYLAFKNNVKTKGIKMPYCEGCRIHDRKCAWLKKRCDLLFNNKINYCYECRDFPCDKLEHIDRRYKENFRMSFLDNLDRVKKNGEDKFLNEESKKWKCKKCGELICCHNGICFNCDQDKLKRRRKKYRWG